MLQLAETWSLRWLMTGSLSIAALILTHNLMPMIFLHGLAVLGLGLLLGAQDPDRRLATLRHWLWMAGLGALLSAFFWLPIVFDRSLIQTEHFLRVTYLDELAGLAELLGTSQSHGVSKELGAPLVIAGISGLAERWLLGEGRVAELRPGAWRSRSAKLRLGFQFLLVHTCTRHGKLGPIAT